MSCKDGTVPHCLLVAGAVATLATLVPVALYQTGAIERLPDLPGSWFDSEKVTSSQSAHPFGVPDALLGLGSFSATLALALLAPRARWIEKALGAKLAVDAAATGINAVRQVVEFRALCSWCTGIALAAACTCAAGKKYLKDV